jgi:uncharacterized protein (DUF1501 family)
MLARMATGMTLAELHQELYARGSALVIFPSGDFSRKRKSNSAAN